MSVWGLSGPGRHALVQAWAQRAKQAESEAEFGVEFVVWILIGLFGFFHSPAPEAANCRHQHLSGQYNWPFASLIAEVVPEC